MLKISLLMVKKKKKTIGSVNQNQNKNNLSKIIFVYIVLSCARRM